MPIYLRTFYLKELSEQKKEEKKQMDKANKGKGSSVSRPNISRGPSAPRGRGR